jgi:queuine tRNA-ribosyltransferase
MGYELFDSTMPTRDARHGRLMVFTADPTTVRFEGTDWFRYLYPGDDRHVKEGNPPSAFCDCPLCATYSLGYLHHLYKLNDSLYFRLATLHNLRFMSMLIEALRKTGL